MNFRELAAKVDWASGPVTHIPCVDTEGCGAWKAASVYQDDQGELRYKCFSCDQDTRQSALKDDPKTPMIEESQEPSRPMTGRGIMPVALKKYGVTVTDMESRFPYGQGVTKIRRTDKRFAWEGDSKTSGLFGQNLFPPDEGRSVTLVEGEFDALAAFQMLQGKQAVVSVANGGPGGVKDCKEAYDYLNGFEFIIVCVDDDKIGNKLKDALVEMFPGKIKLFPHNGKYKDANDYVIDNQTQDFVGRWFKAVPPVVEGIVSISDVIKTIDEVIRPVATFPFIGLNDTLGGIFDRRLYMVLAGSGSGKSTFLRQIAHWIWKCDPEARLGMMFLEESPKETVRHLVSSQTGKAAHLPRRRDGTYEVVWAEGEFEKALEHLSLGDRFQFWDHFKATTPEAVLNRMLYLVKVYKVKYIFLDHISIVVSGSAVSDERKAIDNFMTALRQFVEATGVTLFAINHLSKAGDGKASPEEGGRVRLKDARGSGAVYQLSDVVIGCERNQQSEDAKLANQVVYRVLKNRPTGTVGLAAVASYDRLKDILIEEATGFDGEAL